MMFAVALYKYIVVVNTVLLLGRLPTSLQLLVFTRKANSALITELGSVDER